MTKQELIQELQNKIDAIQKQPDDELFTCLIQIDSAQEILETYYIDELNIQDSNWSFSQEKKQLVVDQYWKALEETHDDTRDEGIYWVMEKLDLNKVFGG